MEKYAPFEVNKEYKNMNNNNINMMYKEMPKENDKNNVKKDLNYYKKINKYNE